MRKLEELAPFLNNWLIELLDFPTGIAAGTQCETYPAQADPGEIQPGLVDCFEGMLAD